jgi:Arc/MetJ family transcription regulator
MDTPLRLDIDDDLLQKAARCAQEEGTNMDSLVERLLRDYVDADDADTSSVHSRMERSLRDAESGFAWG